ncbi:MAG: Rid family hydrolase, partial [Pseudomonadota bacterium]
AVAATGFSPAVRAGDFLYLTGATGAGDDGVMPPTAKAQTQNAISKALTVLAETGAGPDAIVEMTSYHTDISGSFDDVQSVLTTLLGTPLPAWTAVEVAKLRRDGAAIELRIVAYHPVAQ